MFACGCDLRRLKLLQTGPLPSTANNTVHPGTKQRTRARHDMTCRYQRSRYRRHCTCLGSNSFCVGFVIWSALCVGSSGRPEAVHCKPSLAGCENSCGLDTEGPTGTVLGHPAPTVHRHRDSGSRHVLPNHTCCFCGAMFLAWPLL